MIDRERRLKIVGLCFLFLLMFEWERGSGEERPSSTYSGSTVYAKPRNFGFFGYSAAPPPPKVDPVGKETSLEIPQTAASPYSSPAGVAPITVPPPGKMGPSDFGGFEQDMITVDSRLSLFMLQPRPVRPSMLQGASFELAYLADREKVRSGMSSVQASATFGFPCPTVNSPLLVTPIFEWTDLHVPVELEGCYDKELSLYSTGMMAEYLLPLSDSFLLDINAQILWANDFRSKNRDSLRIIGYGTGVWRFGPTAHLVLGASYNDVSDFRIVPIAGLLWKPSDELYLELLFPRPKLAWRLPDSCLGQANKSAPYWIYIGGEYETSRWSVESNDILGGVFSNDTRLDYRDLRCYVGLERKSYNELNWAIEGGVVFDRKLTFHGAPAGMREFTPGSTGFARLKILY